MIARKEHEIWKLYDYEWSNWVVMETEFDDQGRRKDSRRIRAPGGVELFTEETADEYINSKKREP